MKVLILVAALLGVFAGAADLHGDVALRKRVTRDATVANLNSYFDSLVGNIRTWAKDKGLDPLSLPDEIQSFDYQGLLADWHGELALTKGSLKDISTLDRRGDVIIGYEDKEMKVTATIGFGDIEFSFDYLAEFMDLEYDGTLEGFATDLKLYVVLDVDVENLKVQLESFDIEHAGELHVEVHGNGLLDILPNIIADVVTALFKDQLLDLIQGEVQNVLEDTISTIDLGSII